MKNKYMKRSALQALYKYLPDSWGDFYSKEHEVSYTTYVKAWNSKMLEGVNKLRLIDEVKYISELFVALGGAIEGFGTDFNADNYRVMTPKCIENDIYSDIKTELSPLLFYCNRCKKVHTFNSRSNYSAFRNKGCQVDGCNGYLKQLSFVYSCGCGFTGPIKNRKCEKHGFDCVIYDGKYDFLCKYTNKPIYTRKICSNCGTMLYPQNALDQKNMIPFSFTLIDFLTSREEEFLVKQTKAPKVILARWLNVISEDEYEEILKLEDLNSENIEESSEYLKHYNKFLTMTDEVQAKQFALATCKTNNSSDELERINEYIDENIDVSEGSSLMKRIANSYLEFRSIKMRNEVLTQEKAAKLAVDNSSIMDEKAYYEISGKHGIENIQVSVDVPLVNCTFGYTRQKRSPKEYLSEKKKVLKLRALKKEDPNYKNVYALTMKTEGILIEFDKVKVLKWLIANEYLDSDMSPDFDDMTDVDTWFINNIDITGISKFDEIDKENHYFTYYVYRLLHTMSHSMLLSASSMAGLDKNSLSEHVFPNEASIFIYCQNNQGLTLGALYTLFSSNYVKWLEKSFSIIDKCIFDPVCNERDKACMGCLYINEISCNHSNKDLDRSLVKGYFDPDTKENILGFWEECI